VKCRGRLRELPGPAFRFAGPARGEAPHRARSSAADVTGPEETAAVEEPAPEPCRAACATSGALEAHQRASGQCRGRAAQGVCSDLDGSPRGDGGDRGTRAGAVPRGLRGRGRSGGPSASVGTVPRQSRARRLQRSRRLASRRRRSRNPRKNDPARPVRPRALWRRVSEHVEAARSQRRATKARSPLRGRARGHSEDFTPGLAFGPRTPRILVAGVHAHSELEL